MKHSRRLLAATIALTTVGWFGLAAPASAASHEANSSAAWLAAQVQSDGLLHGDFGADHGMSVDGMLTLAALGGQSAKVNQMADALAAGVNDYTTGEAFGDVGSVYAGATGKLTTALASLGRSVTSVSGVNLVDRLESTIQTTGANTGRGMDISEWGDYSNGVGQSWVVRGLVAAESSLASDAVEYLLAQQCTDGGFRTNLDAAGCTSGVDTTAYALVSLLEAKAAGVAGSTTSNLDSKINAAKGYLVSAQAANGSFGADDGVNSNSTGLAGWALFEAGETAAGNRAATWIRANTWIRPSGDMAAEGGAIAFSAEVFNADVEAGAIDDRAQWIRATAQAAIIWANAADRATPYEADIDAPASVDAEADFAISATGFEAGESVIVDLSVDGFAGGGSFSAFKFEILDTVTADATGAVHLNATAPATAGDYTLALSSATTAGSAPMQILAADGGSNGDDDGDDDDAKTGAGATGGSGSLPDSGSNVNPALIAGAAGLVLAGAGTLYFVRRREI